MNSSGITYNQRMKGQATPSGHNNGEKINQRPFYQNSYGRATRGSQNYDSAFKSVDYGIQNLKLGTQNFNHSYKDSTRFEGHPTKKTTTWASIASQPAKPTPTFHSTGMKKKGPGMPPGPIIPGKHNIDINTWEEKQPPAPIVIEKAPAWSTPPPQLTESPPHARSNEYNGSGLVQQPPFMQMVSGQAPVLPLQHVVMPPFMGPPPTHPPINTSQPPPQQLPQQQQQQQQAVPPPTTAQQSQPAQQQTHNNGPHLQPTPVASAVVGQFTEAPPLNNQVLQELRHRNNYNPVDFNLEAPGARFFVIKSYSEDDIHRSIKYEIWCSTEHGNKRLDFAFRETTKAGGLIYLFFSVNSSGHFCGMAQMVSAVDYHSNSSVWAQDKWKGQFRVRWLYVKDVPNAQLRHIKLENNENKAVTNSRDTQEVPHAKGVQVLKILHAYQHTTSIFDDFIHYEERQMQEDVQRKVPEPDVAPVSHHYRRKPNFQSYHRPSNYNKYDNNNDANGREIVKDMRNDGTKEITRNDRGDFYRDNNNFYNNRRNNNGSEHFRNNRNNIDYSKNRNGEDKPRSGPR